MNTLLIFTERRLIPRVIDAILTIIAWIGFLYLVYHGLIVSLANSPYQGIRPFFTSMDTVRSYILISLVNGMVLIGWAKYNQFRFRAERRYLKPELKECELAKSLYITSEVFIEMNKAKNIIIYHHDNGEIASVEIGGCIIDNRLIIPMMSEILPSERLL